MRASVLVLALGAACNIAAAQLRPIDAAITWWADPTCDAAAGSTVVVLEQGVGACRARRARRARACAARAPPLAAHRALLPLLHPPFSPPPLLPSPPRQLCQRVPGALASYVVRCSGAGAGSISFCDSADCSACAVTRAVGGAGAEACLANDAALFGSAA